MTSIENRESRTLNPSAQPTAAVAHQLGIDEACIKDAVSSGF